MVDLAKFEPWTIFYHVVKVLIMYNVSRTLLKNKYNQFLSFLVFFVITLGYNMFCLFLASIIPFEIYEFFELFIFLISFVIVFVICNFLYDGKVSTKIISSVLAGLAYPTIGAISHIIIVAFSPDFAEYSYNFKVPVFLLVSETALIFFASFIITAILKFVNAKRNSRFSGQIKLHKSSKNGQ